MPVAGLLLTGMKHAQGKKGRKGATESTQMALKCESMFVITSSQEHSRVHCALGMDLAGLPTAWLASLVAEHLDPQDRLLLLLCSHDLAEVVLQQAPSARLTLTAGSATGPAVSIPSMQSCGLQHKRASALQLAANSPNLHLHLHGAVEALPACAWKSITHLSLEDVQLGPAAFAKLCLPQLQHLHTLTLLTSDSDAAPLSCICKGQLQAAVKQGALQSIRSLHVQSPSHKDAVSTLQCLATLLGQQVTKLVLCSTPHASVLPSFPAVTDLELHDDCPPCYVDYPISDDERLRLLLLSHPKLQRLTLPSWPHETSQQSFLQDLRPQATHPCHWESVQCGWESVHLTRECDIETLVELAQMGVQHLKVKQGISTYGAEQQLDSMTVQLQHCPDGLSCIPVACIKDGIADDLLHGMGVPKGMPTFTLSGQRLHPWLVQQSTKQLTGAFILWDTHLCQVDLQAALPAIPKSVSWVVFVFPRLDAGVSWAAVLKALSHISHVAIHAPQLPVGLYDLMALCGSLQPTGLSQLTFSCLHSDAYRRKPLALAADVRLQLQALAAAQGVELAFV